jgi:hypothetical protein
LRIHCRRRVILDSCEDQVETTKYPLAPAILGREPQLGRSFIIELDGVTLDAEMLDDKAPETCNAFWQILPFDDKALHCMMSGECIYVSNKCLPALEPENRTPYVSQGDILMAPNECVIVYGRRCFLVDSRTGPLPANHFAIARRPEQLTAFEKVAKGTHELGARPISFRKA